MANFFLYGGLGLILVAIILALIAAIIGCKIQDWKFPDIILPRRFIGPPLKIPRNMRMLLKISCIILIIGGIILGIGFWIALK